MQMKKLILLVTLTMAMSAIPGFAKSGKPCQDDIRNELSSSRRTAPEGAFLTCASKANDKVPFHFDPEEINCCFNKETVMKDGRIQIKKFCDLNRLHCGV